VKSKALFTVVVVLLGGIGWSVAAEARPISPPSTVDTLATVGSPCERNTSGAVSWNQDDLHLGLICSPLPNDDRYLWRPLDSSVNPYVGSIDRLYGAYFDRAPDVAGFAYWVRQYLRSDHPVPLAVISDLFAASSEFREVPSPDFVRWVYGTVLDREPDPGGYTYWTELLASRRSTPGQLMVFFSESAEHRAKTHTV
jgi:hypothetical protein